MGLGPEPTVFVNPLGRPAEIKYPPCAVAIFGGAGALSHRKLLPALYNLTLDGELPEHAAIVSFSMEEFDDDSYRAFARDAIQENSRRPIRADEWNRFARMLSFVRGRFNEAPDYQTLRIHLEKIDRDFGTAGNRVYYFAIPPNFIETCATGLHDAKMIRPPNGDGTFTRVVVEKPIGHDLASATAINDRIAMHFHESQIFRIDHYLGKETVENLMVLRFANAIFEPLWTSRFIDHVQITVAEEEGVGARAAYYETAGALRDMVQSHMLQVLSIIAMEPPRSTAADSVRDAKLDVLQSIRPFSDEEIEKFVVRGQYSAGLVAGAPARAYREEDHVEPQSRVETFVALKCWIDNWRWAGVPFYLRTGKRLPKRASEIAIYFKSVPRILYNSNPRAHLAPNMLTIRIQPDEGLSVHIVSKVPGAQVRLQQVAVDFHYATTTPEAYETLLRDIILGDQTLFMRRDSVETSWQLVDPILGMWLESPDDPPLYSAGSWGPLEAALMMAADGRSWRAL
ncbi:MAG TPA: glucose-6-phosphate dehydrogenase [Candidatus Binataceae bacterium]|nr:glucose-6-phosphate dehydrogenase [Candidatus Binataceae bacterium]